MAGGKMFVVQSKKQKAVDDARRKQTRKIASKVTKRILSMATEQKFLDTQVTASGLSTSATIASLTEVAQGDGDFQRDGDELRINGFEMRYSLVGADLTNVARIIIFQWHAIDTVAPVAGDILQVATDPLSAYYKDGKPQFKVLYDRIHALTDDQSNALQVVVKKKLPRHRRKVHFEGGGTDGQNKLYYLAMSDSGAVSHPSWDAYFRLLFTDN